MLRKIVFSARDLFSKIELGNDEYTMREWMCLIVMHVIPPF